MRGLMICVLATTWVVGVIYMMGNDDLRARMNFRRARDRYYGRPGERCNIHGVTHTLEELDGSRT